MLWCNSPDYWLIYFTAHECAKYYQATLLETPYEHTAPAFRVQHLIRRDGQTGRAEVTEKGSIGLGFPAQGNMWNLWQSWKLNLGVPSSGLRLTAPLRTWHLLYLMWVGTPWGLQSGALLEGGPVPRSAQPTPRFFQSGSDWGEVCMATYLSACWKYSPCVQPEASLLATFPISNPAKKGW